MVMQIRIFSFIICDLIVYDSVMNPDDTVMNPDDTVMNCDDSVMNCDENCRASRNIYNLYNLFSINY
jgi:hypothetical protein